MDSAIMLALPVSAEAGGAMEPVFNRQLADPTSPAAVPADDLQGGLNTSVCALCRRVADGLPAPVGNQLAVAFDDAFPAAPGHMLIVSRRHAARLHDLTPEEQRALWELVPVVCALVMERHAPAAFNIGLNDGPAAGQTVPHVHVHVLPRYPGDVEDPRGGVRWVLPQRAAYWESDVDD